MLDIRDDGAGFDMTQVSEGNGLLNMQERAIAMQGKVEIVSTKGSCTAITLKAPIGG